MCAGIGALLVAPAVCWGDTYLALGDSLAFGYSTFLQTPQGFGDNGYVRRFADHLGTVQGARPEVLNFAVPGESSADFFAGPQFGFLYNQNYFDTPVGGADFTQAELLRRTLDEHAAGTRTITNVTVHLGVNDLLAFADDPGFLALPIDEQLVRIAQTVGDVAARIDQILGDITSTAPGAEVAVMGYYNPFAIRPSDPPRDPTQRPAARSGPAIRPGRFGVARYCFDGVTRLA